MGDVELLEVLEEHLQISLHRCRHQNHLNQFAIRYRTIIAHSTVTVPYLEIVSLPECLFEGDQEIIRVLLSLVHFVL